MFCWRLKRYSVLGVLWKAEEFAESNGIPCQQNSHWTLDVMCHLTLAFPSGHFRIRYYWKSITDWWTADKFLGLAGIPKFELISILIGLQSSVTTGCSGNTFIITWLYWYQKHRKKSTWKTGFYKNNLVQVRKNFLLEGTKSIWFLFICNTWQLQAVVFTKASVIGVLMTCSWILFGIYTFYSRFQRILIDWLSR